jgi:hypothetical protein
VNGTTLFSQIPEGALPIFTHDPAPYYMVDGSRVRLMSGVGRRILIPCVSPNLGGLQERKAEMLSRAAADKLTITHFREVVTSGLLWGLAGFTEKLDFP